MNKGRTQAESRGSRHTRDGADGNSRLVYSTDGGRIKPGKTPKTESSTVKSGDGYVRIRRETSGRRGGAVTTIHGLYGSDADIKKLGKDLKKRCGSGGTVKNGIIEIQGDHRETLATVLTERGYSVKMAGG